MSLRVLFTALAVTATLTTGASAQVRELGQSELRASVAAGRSLGLRQLLQSVQSRVEGELVDVRAFESGDIFYKILVKLPDGRLASVVVDARTGQFVNPNSSAAKNIQAASSGNGKANGKAKDKSNKGGKSSNSNRGGGGNSGGGNSGGGNSGGGGGNSGGGGGKGKK